MTAPSGPASSWNTGSATRPPLRGRRWASSRASAAIFASSRAHRGFEVGRCGPSGLGSVEVYGTIDEGANWEKSPADPNVSLPVTSETRGLGPVHGTVTVSLPKDGVIYGFYLVVKSRAGLGKS